MSKVVSIPLHLRHDGPWLPLVFIGFFQSLEFFYKWRDDSADPGFSDRVRLV